MINTRIGGGVNYNTSILLNNLKNKELDQLQYVFQEIVINVNGYAEIVAPDTNKKYAFAEIINWKCETNMVGNVINICGPTSDGSSLFYLMSNKSSITIKNVIIRFFYYKNR